MAGDPLVSDDDLTAKAKIRNAALTLYADRGEDAVSMRAVAAAAGVTVGLVQHHFKTKAGLRDAVEQLIVDYFARAIASAPTDGTTAQVAAARDEAVGQMLAANPTVVDYMRRSLLDPRPERNRLLGRLTELTRAEVAKLRGAGVASTRRAEAEQVVDVMVRQVGHLFLQPMIDVMWGQLTDETATPPELEVTLMSGHEG